MKTKILKQLSEQDSYISGQELCDQFGVSRTAIWKVMNQLKEEGYIIESVPNKGYHLVSKPDILSKNEIESGLDTKWAGRKLYYFDETGSTNDDVKRFAEEGDPHGTLVVADKQNAGRGRRGRTWVSEKGDNVYFSIALKPDMSPNNASMLTLVMALAVTKAIREETELEALIKWPNDIVVNHKKVCGMLTEMTMELDYIHEVVIGVGININQTSFPEEIQQNASSLYVEGGKKIMRSALLQKVMRFFEQYYEQFMETQDLSKLIPEYNQLLVNLDTGVKVLDPKGEYEGVARGVDEQGQLLVEKDGEIIKVYAGEVSVRGFYGYV